MLLSLSISKDPDNLAAAMQAISASSAVFCAAGCSSVSWTSQPVDRSPSSCSRDPQQHEPILRSLRCQGVFLPHLHISLRLAHMQRQLIDRWRSIRQQLANSACHLFHVLGIVAGCTNALCDCSQMRLLLQACKVPCSWRSGSWVLTSILSTDRVSVTTVLQLKSNPEALSCPLGDHHVQAALPGLLGGLQLKQTNGLGESALCHHSLWNSSSVQMGNTERRQPMKPSQEVTVLFCFGHFYGKLFVFCRYSFVKARTEELVRPNPLALHVHGGVVSSRLEMWLVTRCNTQGNVTFHMYTHTHSESQIWSKTFKPAYPIGLSIKPDETGRKGVIVTGVYCTVVVKTKKKCWSPHAFEVYCTKNHCQNLSVSKVQFGLVLHKSGCFSKVMALARIEPWYFCCHTFLGTVLRNSNWKCVIKKEKNSQLSKIHMKTYFL